MKNSPLNRRGFLRLCVVAAGGAVVASCQQKLQGLATVTAVVPTGTPLPTPKLNLGGADQDVWTWVKPMKVAVSGACQSVVVDVNGKEFETQPEGETFTGNVRFSSGVNRVSAACKQPDGVDTRSNMLNYTERL